MLKITYSEDVIVMIAGTILLVLLGGFIISFLFFFRNRQQKNNLEQQKLKSEYIQAIFEAKLEVQEQTLRTIGEEIHDNIGQILSLAKLNLSILPTEQLQLIGPQILASKNLIGKAIHDLRNISHTLNTDYVQEMGLARAVEHDLDIIRNSGDIQTTLNIVGTKIAIDKKKELILFRVLQETLNNIIKHAEAKLILIDFIYSENMLVIKIEDNGKGFTYDNVKGNGMLNMRNRAIMIGAELVVSSTPGLGTCVRIEIPLQSDQHE